MPETPLRPLCFMVMPFGTKPVVPVAENGVSAIDFDALWAKAFEPVIRELGYEPVRADQDIGSRRTRRSGRGCRGCGSV
jgi:hypothetical protein